MVQLQTIGKDSEIKYSFSEKSFTWFLQPEQVSPITIAVPHDGLRKNDLRGLFPNRKNGCHGTDMLIWPLVKGIAWNVPVTVIRGMLPRFMLDYNRYASKRSFRSYAGELFEDTEEACDGKRLMRYHKAYHHKMLAAVRASKEIYGSKALFFDFHGFGKQPPYGTFDIILGTANTHTLKSDIDKRFAEFFCEKGYSVFLPAYRQLPLQHSADWYDAGFTTRNVFLQTGVDAIQVEIASPIRREKDRAEMFSAHMGEFLKIL